MVTEYTPDMTSWDETVRVREYDNEKVRVETDSFETAVKVLGPEEYDYDDSGATLVVGSPHWKALRRDRMDIVVSVLNRHFGGRFFRDDESFYKFFGEWPPWNPTGEGFD